MAASNARRGIGDFRQQFNVREIDPNHPGMEVHVNIPSGFFSLWPSILHFQLICISHKSCSSSVDKIWQAKSMYRNAQTCQNSKGSCPTFHAESISILLILLHLGCLLQFQWLPVGKNVLPWSFTDLQVVSTQGISLTLDAMEATSCLAVLPVGLIGSFSRVQAPAIMGLSLYEQGKIAQPSVHDSIHLIPQRGAAQPS